MYLRPICGYIQCKIVRHNRKGGVGVYSVRLGFIVICISALYITLFQHDICIDNKDYV